MNPLRVETYFPCAVSLATAGTASIWVHHLPSVPEPLAATTVTVGVVIAGFTATQRNMLLGMKDLPLLKTMATTGHDADLTLYLRQCLWSCIALILVSGTRFFLEDLPPVFTPLWTIIWFGNFAFVITSTVRNERLIFQMIGKFLRSQGHPPSAPPSAQYQQVSPQSGGTQVAEKKAPATLLHRFRRFPSKPATVAMVTQRCSSQTL